MRKKDAIKKKKLVRKGPGDSTRDQFTVVLEDLRSHFQVIGEGVSATNEKLDRHDERLDSIENKLDGHGRRLDSIESKLDGQGQRLDSIENKLEGVENRLEGVETKMVVVESDLTFVKEQLSIIRHNQVTRDEFHLLETRVARLERTRQR